MVYIFIKKSQTRFEIIIIDVDDLHHVGTLEEFIETAKYLKKTFEIKDFGKTKFYLGM